ncbi:MAG: hypothetical protein WAU69_11590 [Solirubrobacteraceae bacterium]
MQKVTGNCGEATGRLPILVESSGESRIKSGGGIRSGTIEGMVVATRSVAAVAAEKYSISQHPPSVRRERWLAAGTFPLHNEPGLPDGLRTAVVAIQYKESAGRPRSLVRFLPLNANGKQIPEAKAKVALSTMLPVRSVNDAAHGLLSRGRRPCLRSSSDPSAHCGSSGRYLRRASRRKRCAGSPADESVIHAASARS